ncbi:protein-glutamine gamma-glutamyltransferase TgpA [soil metagenome]
MALQARSDMELWDRPFQTQLIAVLAVNVAGHALNVQWWVLLASVIALAWKLGHLYFGWRLPKRSILYGIGAVFGAVIFWQHKTMLGHEAATPILVFLASLKLLETNRDRDAKFIIVTSYFLLMAHLLQSQSLGSTFFMAFDVAIITILMFQLHRSDRTVNARTLRPVVRLLIFTIPVWLCLFVIFPRFTLRLLRTSGPAQATGFNEGLDPGSVSSLAQSEDVAFRVHFLSGKKRNPEQLYWRGATLYNGDGLKWRPRGEDQILKSGATTRSLPLAKLTETEFSKNENLLNYEIVTENNQGRAIFSLPTVVAFRPGNGMDFLRPFVTNDGLLRVGNFKHDHVSYRLASIPETESESTILPAEQRRESLDNPSKKSAQYQALIEELREDVSTPFQAMAKIDAFFLDEDFRYTLALGDAKSLSIDDFLFRNKRGFCEHFAGTSATLLRSLGFPARVVVGYQGGKWNQISNALIVRSRDAHAWVEVWSPSKIKVGTGRWVTYDPTASIAPLRLRLGGDFLDLPEEQQQQRDMENSQLLEHLSQNLFLKAIDRSMMVWDYAQMSWTTFLLGYDQSGQRSLLNKILEAFGAGARPWVMIVLLATLFGIMLRLIFQWQSRGQSETALRREWNSLELELRRIGAFTSIRDGPLTIRDRLTSETMRDGIDAFIEIQYGATEVDRRETLRRIREARREAKRLPTSPSPPTAVSA